MNILLHNLITNKKQKINFKEITSNVDGWYSGAFGYLPSVIDTIIHTDNEIQLVQQGKDKINKKIIKIKI